METKLKQQMVIVKFSTQMSKVILFIAIMISSSMAYSQSCKIFEIKGVEVYLYPTFDGEKNTSNINDSVSYTILKVSKNKYQVEKIINEFVVCKKDYSYKGKQRYQVIKMRKRKAGKVTIVKEKQLICLLE